MLLHANGTNRGNVLERQILIVSGRVLKHCYLHNNMDADCNCIYDCYLCCLYIYYQFIVRFPIGLVLHNTPFAGVLMKSIGAEFSTGCPS